MNVFILSIETTNDGVFAMSRDGDKYPVSVEMFREAGYPCKGWEKEGVHPFNFCVAEILDDKVVAIKAEWKEQGRLGLETLVWGEYTEDSLFGKITFQTESKKAVTYTVNMCKGELVYVGLGIFQEVGLDTKDWVIGQRINNAYGLPVLTDGTVIVGVAL